MRFIKFIVVLCLFLFCLLFFTQNKEALSLNIPLKIDLFVEGLKWESTEIPYYFIALGCLIVGTIITTLFFILDRLKMTYSLVEKKVKISRCESEIKRLTAQLEESKQEVEKSKSLTGNVAPVINQAKQ